MYQLAVSESARNRLYVVGGWLAAVAASSHLYIVVIGYADTLAWSCGWASLHSEAWVAFLFAMLIPLAMLAYIVWITYGGRTRRKKRLRHMVPSLFISFPAYAFAVAHMAGWGVCDVSILPFVAASMSVGAVLSGVMFGACCVVYCAREKGPSWLVVTLGLAAAALTYYVFQMAAWDSPHEIGWQLLVTIAMAAMAIAAGIFGAEYGKNRGQRQMWWWLLPIFLIAAGASAFYTASSQGSWDVGDGDHTYLYIVSSMWAGVAVTGVMLGAPAAANFPKKHPLVWLGPTIMLAVLAVPYHYTSSDWVCLVSMDACADPSDLAKSIRGMGEYVAWRMQIYLAVLLSFLIMFSAMAAAMLGAAVVAYMTPERDGAPPSPYSAMPEPGTPPHH